MTTATATLVIIVTALALLGTLLFVHRFDTDFNFAPSSRQCKPNKKNTSAFALRPRDSAHLFVNVYDARDCQRNAELSDVFCHNAYNAQFDAVHVLVDTADRDQWPDWFRTAMDNRFIATRLRVCVIPHRPTFSDYLQCAHQALLQCNALDAVMCIANSDMYVPPDTVLALKRRAWPYTETLALTRYDAKSLRPADLRGAQFHWPGMWSQDTWCFRGTAQLQALLQQSIGQYHLGKPRCDHRFARQMKEAGFVVRNCSLTLRTFHLHNSNLSAFSSFGLISLRLTVFGKGTYTARDTVRGRGMYVWPTR